MGVRLWVMVRTSPAQLAESSDSYKLVGYGIQPPHP